jgi:hypothetical protein
MLREQRLTLLDALFVCALELQPPVSLQFCDCYSLSVNVSMLCRVTYT